MERSRSSNIIIIFFFVLVGVLAAGCLYFSFRVISISPNSPVVATSQQAGLNSQRMLLADSVIMGAIERGEFPGAVLCVVKRADDGQSMGRVAYIKAYGNMQVTSGKSEDGKTYIPDTLPMREDAVFDLASLTKSVGTTLAFMRLLDDGKVTLRGKVKDYIPDFKPWDSIAEPDDDKRRNKSKGGKPKVVESCDITIQQLLTHTSGMPAGIYVSKFMQRFEEYDIDGLNLQDSLIYYLAQEERRLFRPGSDIKYSCLNYVLLQRIIEDLAGEPLDAYTDRVIFAPLGLSHTAWCPIEMEPTIEPSLFVPTEISDECGVLRGVVHDPIARVIQRGVSGNAGLFSNAEDLAVLVSMIMNRGVVGDARVLSSAAVDAMLRIPDDYIKQERSLGWDAAYDRGGSYGDLMTPHCVVSHTGYTGTSIAIDMHRGVSVILLTNRVHPLDKGSVSRTRNVIANIVMSALD